MIRYIVVCAFMACGGSANAQTADWKTHVGDFVSDMADAAADKSLVIYSAEVEHPDITAAIAASIGIDVATYGGSVRQGSTAFSSRMDSLDFDILADGITYGIQGDIPWAIVKYRLQWIVDGAPTHSPTCPEMLIYRIDGEVYGTMISLLRNATLLADAVPDLSGVASQSDMACPAD